VSLSLDKPSDVMVGSGTVVLPRVNLLPPEIAEQAHFRRVQGGLGLAVVAAVGLVGLLYTGASGSVGDAQAGLDQAQAQQSALQAETATYRDVTARYAKAAAVETMLVQAMGTEVQYSGLLNDLSLTVPDGVWVTNAQFSQTEPAAGGTTPGIGTVTMTGVALSYDDVALWLESQATQKGYDKPYLQTSTEALLAGKKVVNWSSTVVLTPDALSGRYTKAGS